MEKGAVKLVIFNGEDFGYGVFQLLHLRESSIWSYVRQYSYNK
jgi:hypothetical protein